MKKGLLITAFLIGCFSFGLAHASGTVTVDFDTLDANSTSSWSDVAQFNYFATTTSYFTATTSLSVSSPNSAYLETGADFGVIFASTTADYVSFDYWFPTFTGMNRKSLIVFFPFTNLYIDSLDNSVSWLTSSGLMVTSVSSNNWHNYKVAWNSDNQTFAVTIDNLPTWEDQSFWHSVYEITNFYVNNSNSPAGTYFDNIVFPEPVTGGTVFSYDFPSINITYPYQCQQNVVATTTGGLSFYITGNVSNPPFSQYADATTLSNVQAHFWTLTGEEATTVVLYAGDIPPDTMVGFHIPVILPDDHYQVTYTADGLNDDIRFIPVSLDSCRTFVGSSLLSPSEIKSWGEPCAGIYEDCVASSTSWTDKILCTLERVGLALVCPSRATLTKAIGIKDDIAGRFPVSLFAVGGNFLNDLQNSTLYVSSTATTTMFSTDISPFKKFAEFSFFIQLRQILILLVWASVLPVGIVLLMKFGFIK